MKIMKFRTTKEFNLAEMIQHIMENEELKGQNYSPRKQEGRVKISYSGDVYVVDICADDTFIVEVEEEVTEETNLTFSEDFTLIGLIRRNEEADYGMGKWSLSAESKVSISGIKDIYDLQSLHKVNGDGSLTLLYTEEHGIPVDGVLEYEK